MAQDLKQCGVDKDKHEHLVNLTSNLLDLQRSGRLCDVQLTCSDGVLMGEDKIHTRRKQAVLGGKSDFCAVALKKSRMGS